MNLKKLVEAVFARSSNWMMTKGENLFKRGLVSKVSSKKIDKIYHIYGTVINENKRNKNNTHIKINLSNTELEEANCDCDNFQENSKYNKTFLCEHIIGTTYMFYNMAQRNIRVKKDDSEETCKNKPANIILSKFKNYGETDKAINIDIKLNHIRNSSQEYFEAEFKIGKNNLYPINSLEDFIESRIKGTNLFISNEFTYNPMLDSFSSEAEKLVDFIQEYVLISKVLCGGNLSSSFQIVKGRWLRILPKTLRRFLEIIHNKKIVLKYKSLEYHTKILIRELPISFTLKEGRDGLILTTKKKFPIPLTSDGDVYLYDRQVYLPSITQREIYKVFYDYLTRDGSIVFNKDAEVFQELISVLSKISRDINLDESVKSFSSMLLKPKFYLHKELDIIHCEVKLNYGKESIDLSKDSKDKSSIIRDFKKEEKIEMELERLRFIKRDNRFLFIGDDEELYNLLRNGGKILGSIGEIILSSGFKDIKLCNSSFIESSIIEDENGFLNFFFNLADVAVEEFKSIFAAFNENKPFYKTKDNNFIDLEDDGIRNFLNLIEILRGGTDIEENSLKVHRNKAYYIKNSNVAIFDKKDILNTISNKLINLDSLDYNVPKDLNAILRQYQEIGYKWMKTLAYLGFGGILADEMGLGKTIQTIGFLLSERETKSLIVTPTSLIYNWKDEFEKFAPNLKVGIVHGNKEERIKVLDNKEQYDILLTTYGTLRMDFTQYESVFFDFCIIDEGQNIKNPLAQSTEKLKKINSKVRFALTGTPIENNLTELWSIFDFIMPGYLYSREKFQQKFINKGEENLDQLKSLIRPFILRRLKQDVLKELPDKIEKKFLVEMTQGQRQIYKSYMKSIREGIKRNKGNRIAIFSYLTKLRQLCLDPSLIMDDYLGGSGKLKIAIGLVQDGINEGKKILLFSQFTSVLKKISEVLKEAEINYLYLDGSTNATERVKLVKEFNESSNVNIFLISLKAGGTGLNLTSANLVIHFDPWWNPSIEDQATDRAHRIGQKNVVEVIKLVAKETIEEKIVALQEDKKELINNVMTGEIESGKLLNTLSEEEILDLFN